MYLSTVKKLLKISDNKSAIISHTIFGDNYDNNYYKNGYTLLLCYFRYPPYGQKADW